MNLTFTNNAANIASLSSKVKAELYFAEQTDDVATKNIHVMNAKSLQTALDVHLVEREEIIKTVSKDDIRDYINEQQKMAKKFKTHADLINAHVAYYINL